MSKGSRSREVAYGRDDRRVRTCEPSSIDARVYIGNVNVKSFSHREINDWMAKYGRVLDVVFFERHILVQFERESEASRAIDREKGQNIRGARFDIRFASSSDGPMGAREDLHHSRSPRALPYDRVARDISPGYNDSSRDRSIDKERHYKEHRASPPDNRTHSRSRSHNEEKSRINSRFDIPQIENHQDPNWNVPQMANKVSLDRPSFDAAIIVMSSELLNYAETIESKFQEQIPLTTHIIVLKEEGHANACIDDLEKKGVLYAFLVNHMNEKHLSCTLRILHGSGQEHRNMLLANALTFVARNFEDYQKVHTELKVAVPKTNYDPSRMPPGFVAPDDKIIYQLHLLADSRMLTIEELNEVDEFIQKRIQVLAQAEGIIEKNDPPKNDLSKDKSFSTHQNILNILKPPTMSTSTSSSSYQMMANNNNNNNNIMALTDHESSMNTNMGQYNNEFDNNDCTGGGNTGYMSSIASNPLPNSKVQQALDTLMQSKFRPDQLDDSSSSRGFSSNQPNNNNNQYMNQMNSNNMGMMNPNNPGMMNPNNPGMMNQPMNMIRGQSNNNSNNNMMRAAMQPGTNPYGNNFPGTGGFYPQQQQQQQPQLGQPVFRPRPSFQSRPQYPGY